MDVWKLYFDVIGGNKFDMDLTPETCIGEVFEALKSNGLLTAELLAADGVMFSNKKNNHRIVCHDTDNQKTIAELGFERDAMYTVLPENIVA